MSVLPDVMRENPVFACITQPDFDLVVQRVSTRSYMKGEKLILLGDIFPYLFLVGEGKVEAVKESPEGRSLSVGSFQQRDVFWGMAFFHENAPMPVTLDVRENSLIYLWSQKNLLPILLRNGQASWELSRLLAERMHSASQLVEGLAFQPVAGRLAHLLLENFEMAGNTAISRHLTLDEMAARIGSTREMVCRALYSFSDKKLIEVTRTEFVLTDREGLSQLVERG
jgi:CRP/FNR family transcriptional regulator